MLDPFRGESTFSSAGCGGEFSGIVVSKPGKKSLLRR